MPERGFDSGFWTDPFVRKLCPNGKLLFSYLWTNDHCNQAGVYQIDLETIAFETKLSGDALPELLRGLSPKVEWFPELDIIWVKNFVRRQAKSPKFLIAAAKCLKILNNNGIAKEVVAYNLQHHSISIPYAYTTDSVSIPPVSVSVSRSVSVSGSEEEGEVKERGKPGGTATTATETATESELLRFVETLEGWRFGRVEDLTWLREFRQDWPDFNLSLAKGCRDWHSGRAPPKHKGVWKNRFREWMIKEREFERRDKTGGTHQQYDQEPSAERYRQSLKRRAGRS